jgi:hypothetical protein
MRVGGYRSGSDPASFRTQRSSVAGAAFGSLRTPVVSLYCRLHTTAGRQREESTPACQELGHPSKIKSGTLSFAWKG